MGVPSIRPSRPGDAEAVAALVYETSQRMYDDLAGGRGRAVRLLARAFERRTTNASLDVFEVVELEGTVGAAMAAFPASELRQRENAMMKFLLPRMLLRRLPRVLYLNVRARLAAPRVPLDALYVATLATDARFRRRGLARLLLARAEQRARLLALPRLALDTVASNVAARALYESAGFEPVSTTEPLRGVPSFVLYLKTVPEAAATRPAP